MRIFWPVTLAAAALVGLLAYGVVSKGTDTTLDDAVAKGQRPAAPISALPWLQQQGSGSLADYKGKVVVLNVWASWCDPCREEVPLLQKTHEQIEAKGGVVLGLDTQDASNKAIEFLKERKATFPSLRDRDRSYGREFGVTGYPETFLIDRKGRIAALQRFPVTQAWLDQQLPKLLGGAGMRLALVALALLLALAAPALAQAPRASLPDIEDEVMCVECGTVLSVSTSPVANQERTFIREQIAAGKDKAQIKAALVDEYGEEILAQPKASGFNAALWIVPIVLVLLAAGGIGVAIKRWRANAGEPEVEAELPPELSTEDAQRLDAELSR